MEKTPTQYLHRSGWGERIALLLLSLVLVAFPVYRMYIEKEITFKYILLLVLALLVIAFLCRSFKVDEFGITVYWFALFPQLIPWKSIRRIEYAALLTDVYSAQRAVLSNNSNIACIGAFTIGNMLAQTLLETWLDLEFDPNCRSKDKVDRYKEYDQARG